MIVGQALACGGLQPATDKLKLILLRKGLTAIASHTSAPEGSRRYREAASFGGLATWTKPPAESIRCRNPNPAVA